MTSGASRAGRPRNFDTEAVLLGALDLFWQNGYRSTTLNDLAAYLKLSQSSLYNAFGSKEELLFATLDRYETAIEGAVMNPLEESEEGLAAIDRFLGDLARWITQGRKRGCMVTNLMAEDRGASGRIKDRTRGYRARVRASLRRALQRAHDLGELGLPEGGAELILDGRADLLMALILGLSVAARGGAEKQEVLQLLSGARAEVSTWHQPRTQHQAGS